MFGTDGSRTPCLATSTDDDDDDDDDDDNYDDNDDSCCDKIQTYINNHTQQI